MKVKELIETGVAGTILTIQADEFYDGGRTYFRRWNRMRALGGGLWITKACHDFDLLYWLAGARPKTIYASCSLDHYVPKPQAAKYCRDCALLLTCPDRYDSHTPPGSPAAKRNALLEQGTGQRPDLCLYNSEKDRGFDHGIATITFANGVIASYTLNIVAGFTNRTLRLGGTKATIDADLVKGSLIVRHRDPSWEERIDLAVDPHSHGGADEFVFANFARFVHGLPARYVAPTEAAVAVQIGLAARQSADEGTVVRVPA